MPLRPELRPFYGHHWRTVTRPRILERAGGRCERCGRKIVRLEVAHLVILPPDPRHDQDDNLAGLCVRCHKAQDWASWSKACRATRARRKDRERPILACLEAS